MLDKKYQETHPWINFQLDLRNLPYSVWMLLGAAQSKCRHLSGIPLHPEKQKELLKISLRKGIRATTAIEGNSLSEDEVQGIIDGNSLLAKSKHYQKTEIENVLRVYNDIALQIKSSLPCRVGCEQIKKDNATILDNLEKKEDVVPGEIRKHSVVVLNYRGAPAEDCEYLLSRLCTWLNEDWGLGEDYNIVEAILKAILGHLYIAWIHPFADGNGRTARALELRILMTTGVPMNAAHLLSNHYNETRSEYYACLDKTSSARHGNPLPFISYAVQGLVDALDEQIDFILNEQLMVTWVNYVYHCFAEETTPAKTRQRDLLLEISKNSELMEPSDIRKRLSDKLIDRYDNKSKTFRRDINALLGRDLLHKEGTKIGAAKYILRAFLPISKSR